MPRFRPHLRQILAVALGLLAGLPIAAATSSPNPYRVVWSTPGKDYRDSMPIGNGDLAANVWTEANGDVVLLLSKTDAWSENGELLKLGRVRIHLSPAAFTASPDFRQVLRPRQGEIDLRGARHTTARIWVDANAPVLHVELHSDAPLRLRADAELWRTRPRRTAHSKQNIELSRGMREVDGNPQGYVEIEPDTVLPATATRITWLHENTRSIYPAVLQNQHLQQLLAKYPDPLLHRIFGVSMQGPGLVSHGDQTLQSTRPGKTFLLNLYALTTTNSSIPRWQAAMGHTIARIDAVPLASARAAHRRWWQSFWQRSWIDVSGNHAADQVTQGFAMQRWMTATSGRGAMPIKFNGGLFAVGQEPPAGTPYDPDKGELTPDYRAWGSNYWFQNQRLLYWPMIADGDFDTLAPYFRMFLHALPLAQDRTRIYFHHQGAIFPETIFFWGLPNNNDFGWGNPHDDLASPWIRHHYNNAIELTAMLLDAWDVTRNRSFARTTLLPLAVAGTTWFDQHWQRVDGKILFSDSQALETRRPATNPAPDIAGLQSVLPRLLALPHDLTTPQQRTLWRHLLAGLPPLPRGRTDSAGKVPLTSADAAPQGQQILWPATVFTKPGNVENPELYAVFPYRRFGVGLPQLQLARATYNARRFISSTCWGQDGIEAADLGWAARAKAEVIANFTDFGPERFPWFWKPGHDWEPDLDNGGAGQLILQHMLLQVRGSKILLFPAWPRDWNVNFKLHAPRNTVVQAIYRQGKLEQLTVTPASRTRDIVLPADIQNSSALSK